jgi:hypothetical protein
MGSLCENLPAILKTAAQSTLRLIAFTRSGVQASVVIFKLLSVGVATASDVHIAGSRPRCPSADALKNELAGDHGGVWRGGKRDEGAERTGGSSKWAVPILAEPEG